MWRHIRGKPGSKTRKTELVLNAFAGYCYACKEKGHKTTHCPNKELKKADTGGTRRHFNGNCDQCGHWGHKKSECWELPKNEEKDHWDIIKWSIEMLLFFADRCTKYDYIFWFYRCNHKTCAQLVWVIEEKTAKNVTIWCILPNYTPVKTSPETTFSKLAISSQQSSILGRCPS